MWERLGFYIMVGILFLYITDTERGGLGFEPEDRRRDLRHLHGHGLLHALPRRHDRRPAAWLPQGRLPGRPASGCGVTSLLGVRSMPFFFAGLALICLGNGLPEAQHLGDGG
jgi:dipeptide/tripeptide permease